MRGETAICDCDERRATCKSATTMGELSYGDDDNWGFGLVLPFWYRVCIRGFFFVFFDKHSILLLVCFDFAL